MNNTPVQLELGLPALLQTLHQSGKSLPNDPAKIIAALASCGHTFDERETATVLDFGIKCAYIDLNDGTLTLSKLGRERLFGKELRKASPVIPIQTNAGSFPDIRGRVIAQFDGARTDA